MPDMPDADITGPSAWIGAEMKANPERWLVHLSPQDVLELETAAEYFHKSKLDPGEISAETFPLERFSVELKSLQNTLINGCGVRVFRGLPVDRYDQKTAAIIFCGIGAHLGKARSQNAQGHILGHVRDVGADANDPNTRIYQTSARQTFHTDSADVVGLLCLRTAKQGGQSLLVSAETIFNRMRATRPDLVALLFDPIATDRRGEIPDGAEHFMTIPPLSWYKNRLTVFYQRQYIDSAQRFKKAMRLSQAHVQALDMFDQLANDPELHFAMQLEPGDMQFVHNHSQLHDRTGFVDWPDPKQRRHLLRLWLSIPGDRPLPDCFRQRYGDIKIGDRGGIITPGTRLSYPLD